MPSDFGIGNYDSEVPAAQDPASGDLRGPVGHAVGPSENAKEMNRVMLKWMADNIREKRYRLLEIVDTSRNGDRALVDVRYGNEKVHYRRALLLLRKVDGEWKIFMLTDRATLEREDPNFAVEKNYL
jgi:hypothetical protein